MNLTVTRVETPKKPLNINHRKEKHVHYVFKGYIIIRKDDGAIKHYDIVDLRTYITPSGKHYVCAWIMTDGDMVSCSASAGGYGYCKSSTAAEIAFLNGGIHFNEGWGGRGIDSIEEAIMAYINYYISQPGFTRELLYKSVGRCYG